MLLRRFGRDCRGSTAMVFALAMPMLIGGLGVGFEISNWYLVQRGMQNAADAAVLAAASNAGANFDVEGTAVAAQFGLVNVNLGQTPRPDIEQKVLDEVGSYGRQLGRIGDALELSALVHERPRVDRLPELFGGDGELEFAVGHGTSAEPPAP